MAQPHELLKEHFNYHLPPELIAQQPLPSREASRLLVLNRKENQLEHKKFVDIIEYVRAGDVLVVNDSRVIPARLAGRKLETGGQVEFLLLDRLSPRSWRALAGGKRLKKGVRFELVDTEDNACGVFGAIIAEAKGSIRVIEFEEVVDTFLNDLGRTPLPPYIKMPLKDPERYQTVYAHPPGSAAAPTAGLHFTADLLLKLREKGVRIETVTLHVGLDTFKPLTASRISDHTIHSEWASLPVKAARSINEAKLAGRRIWAVGTTTVRVLETAALRSAGYSGSISQLSSMDRDTAESCPWQAVSAFEGPTDLFVYPGYRFRVVDSLLTNFHLPQSSLLLLVSAFASREQILRAYSEAIEKRYRFYSFGDAMLII